MAARTTGVTISVPPLLFPHGAATSTGVDRRPPRLVTGASFPLARSDTPSLLRGRRLHGSAPRRQRRSAPGAGPRRGPPSPLAARTSPTPGSPPPPISSQRPPISPTATGSPSPSGETRSPLLSHSPPPKSFLPFHFFYCL
ncbi:uncharacterized protein M6B38_196735 [Iris pallida]|uniref:Uncharacterized protein n=1 Tax=Iris pallida TaxID=29817 RepID=A0AAX6EC06_IRIPA|nr:uncharacterized protein M6B38_196735 [Iris pallida]